MSRWKAAAARLLFPPGWAAAALSLLGYGGVFWVFALGLTGPPAYAAYLLSAYALAIDIAALPRLRTFLKKRAAHFRTHSRVLAALRKTSLGRKYLDSPLFRTKLSLYQGMVVNLLYTVFRTVTGLWYGSVWFLSIATYHFLLGALRAYLAFRYRHIPPGEEAFPYEVHSYKTTGWLLFLLNIPMSGMVILMVRENSGFVYPGLVIYLSALYTFYMTAVSAVNLLKSRRKNSPTLLAARVLHFVSAAMSVLGLQTAMIARFGGEDGSFRQLMNAMTGAGVCALAIGAGIFMIVKSKMVWERTERH